MKNKINSLREKYKSFSERLRILIMIFMLITFPFIITLFIPSNWLEKINTLAWKVYHHNDPYQKIYITGPFQSIGWIKISQKVSLNDLIRKTGGLKKNYIYKENISINISNRQKNIDASIFFLKRKSYKKKSSYDKIKYRDNKNGYKKQQKTRKLRYR